MFSRGMCGEEARGTMTSVEDLELDYYAENPHTAQGTRVDTSFSCPSLLILCISGQAVTSRIWQNKKKHVF